MMILGGSFPGSGVLSFHYVTMPQDLAIDPLGPLAPIWLQSSQATQSGGSLRQHFSDVIPGKYGW